ncbi:hypothetical protein BX616_005977 [Lobosporangium transversale]|uniref:F-box domain-containing protein n=1 Tax=Lobosporangium transversale TaxID=64571 RepID=A0A1Y2GBA0_9FUNG|nr:hypothetical protein BCR41DRAFT_361960 [Lobosporangium transversale]KAF9915527.1 hypothetical protein BX616_005977 [Lobosporangium transversale]ORZ05118.1 hypothetical protein BCR41DRAFT_361960 [Lobosporangium transversale]|eukprot:XP_021876893.1 hypothetical protein BCR41DRAFT_361960 [Lobosporangium transversale]
MAIAQYPIFELPEILAHVGRYLPRATHCVCLQVSRTWYRVFLPMVWVHIHSSDCSMSPKIPLMILRKHAHLIRRLNFYGLISSPFLSIGCTQLERLFISSQCLCTVESGTLNNTRNDIDQLTYLLQTNPRLKDITVMGIRPLPDKAFWGAISQVSHLESLAIIGMNIPKELMEDFWYAIAAHANRLELSSITFPSENHLLFQECVAGTIVTPPLNPHFKRLKHLGLFKFNSSADVQLERILKNCSQLKSLVWRGSHGTRFPRTAITSMRSTGAICSLNSIELDAEGLSDSDLHELLVDISNLEKLVVPNSAFGAKSLTVVLKHSIMITELNLSGCRQIRSPMIQIILSSFPALETLISGTVSAYDILVGDPWVCLKLKTLRINIEAGYTVVRTEVEYMDVEEEEQEKGDLEQGLEMQMETGLGDHISLEKGEVDKDDEEEKEEEEDEEDEEEGLAEKNMIHQAVFERLSTLRQLQVLDISRLHSSGSQPHSSSIDGGQLDGPSFPNALQLRLKRGLYQLKALKQLRDFYFSGPQRMSQRDVLWMLESWPQLIHLCGSLHSNHRRNESLKELLCARGVSVNTW